MPRRFSSSQFRSQLRRIQSKHTQLANRRRQTVNKINQAIRTYNSKVRAHNSRVRANRERLRRELQKLSRTAPQPQYVTFRASVQSVQRSYAALEQQADANLNDDRFGFFLNLSECEAANSVSVINALQGEEPDPPQFQGSELSQIDHVLIDLSPDIRDRWQGALYALNPKNPDAARHFCTSARELLTAILEQHADDSKVRSVLTNCELTPQGKPTRRSKIRFLLHNFGISDDAVTDFIENDIDNVIQLFYTFNDGTHGSAGRFTNAQLLSIRTRVEDAISFLANIISGRAFRPA